MSIFSDDVLNSMQMPSQAFLYQASEATAAVNAKIAKLKQKQAASERKRKRIAETFSQSISIESYDSAYYMQLAIDNLMLALAKETEQIEQTKIQFVLAKAQHILLKDATFELDSQIAIQNQIQALQADLAVKFQEIKTSIADLQVTNQSTTNQATIVESVDQLATAAAITTHTTKSAAKSAAKSDIKLTAKPTTKSYAQIAVQNSQQNQDWQLVQNKKKTATIVNTKSASFSYREKRLILLESKNQEIDFMKIRNQINQDLEKQLKLAANKPVLAAITKSQIQQNIVLTTTDNYNADFLIQHEKIWLKHFKYATTCKDFV